MKNWICIMLVISLLSTCFAVCACAEESSTALHDWNLEETDSFIENASVREKYRKGTLYENDWALVYIPDSVSEEETNWGIFFSGNTSGYSLPDEYIDAVCDMCSPQSIYIYSKESGLSTVLKEDGILNQIADILKGISKDCGIFPETIGVVGYSNGGYTALKIAAYLAGNYGIKPEKVVILDMGMQWGKGEFLITEDEAQPLLEAGTEVYHFTRRGETGHTRGSIQFASYGIPLYEVACKFGDHSSILYNGFANETIFWAVGDISKLAGEIYGEPELINPDTAA